MDRSRSLSTLLWSPLNLAQLLFTLAWSAFWIGCALAVSVVAGQRAALAMARRIWAPGLLAGAGARLTVSGLERVDLARPYLVVANHQSWIDVPVLFRAFPVPLRFVAKSELAHVPLLGAYMRAVGMVLVDRAVRRGAPSSVGRTAELLASGATVVTFPEGTRSTDGRLAPFKSGGFRAALDARAPVLPVAIVGAGAVLPSGGFRVRPGRIELRIGLPLEVGEGAPIARAELARRAAAAVAELLGEPAPGAARRVGGDLEEDDAED